MKRCGVVGLGALLIAAGLIFLAPTASAGCQYGGAFISKCDGPSSLTAPGNVAWQLPVSFPAASVPTWCSRSTAT